MPHPLRHGGQRTDGGLYGVELPPSVVGDDHPVRSQVHHALGVVGVEDALHEQRSVPAGADPLQIVPADVGGEVLRLDRHRLHGCAAGAVGHQVAQGGAAVPQIGVGPPGAQGRLQDAAGGERGRQPHPGAPFPQPVAVDGHVHGHEQRGEAAVAGAVHQGGRQGPVAPRVQLEPVPLVGAAGHLLDAVGGGAAEHHPGAAALGCPCQAEVAVPVGGPGQSDGGHRDGQVETGSGDRGGEVHVRGPGEDPLVEVPVAVGAPVLPQGPLGVGAVLDVGPDHRGDAAAGASAPSLDVQGRGAAGEPEAETAGHGVPPHRSVGRAERWGAAIRSPATPAAAVRGG